MIYCRLDLLLSVVGFWLDVAAGDPLLDELCHVAGAEFAHDALAVELDGVVADEKALGDVARHQSVGDEFEHFDFTRRERLESFHLLAGLAVIAAVVVAAVENMVDGSEQLGGVITFHDDGIGAAFHHLAQCPQLVVDGVEDEGAVGR